MAAALRRLVPSLTNSSKAGAFAAGSQQQTPSTARKALKLVAAGACVAVAAGAAAFYCGVGPRSRVEARLVHLALPSVFAADKVQFRLFSSVECEGQLYMTPLNFIESVTLNEPRSE
ncbi:hypothetical protein GOODEAATRI_004218 [Goodea atripinnis]|uniref:Prohibitin n=1 Tax=Goodea atripinnis TaxID=208336 RepID=A0ABV0N7S1_9TELE